MSTQSTSILGNIKVAPRNILQNGPVENSNGATTTQFWSKTIVGSMSKVGSKGQGPIIQATRDHQTHRKHNANQQGQLGVTHGYKGDQANPNLTLPNSGFVDLHRVFPHVFDDLEWFG